ncbi:MAG: 4Fe-4S dicluster domain-containing protein [Candidatus Aenigmarchaeota archaeon]|nr:4Fe-4S dicluster domain-containing protein [Candidatus Aenigmarchaeota archaeon]
MKRSVIVREALKNFFIRPFTRKYPKVKLIPFPRFSGRIHFYSKRCIGCKLCEKYCPVGAVKFRKKGKIDFDQGLCIFCKMCEDVCLSNPKSIKLSNDFEYADKNKEKVRKNVVVNE